MKPNKKLVIFLLLIIAGYVTFGLFSMAIRAKGYVYPDGSFLFLREDQFMDFFNVNQMVSERLPYVEYYSTYPPLILAVAYVFSLFGNYAVYTVKEIAAMPMGKLSYIVCFGIGTLVLVVCLYKIIRKYSKNHCPAWLAGIAALLSTFTAPYIFMLDRGNYLVVALIFYALFIYYYEDNENLSAVFLGLSAAVKLYPIYMIVVFVAEKKWKKVFITLATAAVAFFVPLLIFRGGYVQNIKEILYALFAFGEGYSSEVPNVYFGVGLSSFLRFPFVVWHDLTVPSWFPVMKIYVLIGAVMTFWSLFRIWREKSAWKRLMVFTTLMVFLIPNSYMYNLTFLTPVILVFLMKKEPKHTWKDYIYLLMLGMIMAPKAYYYMLHEHAVGIQVVLDGLLLAGLVIFYNLFDFDSQSKRAGK